MQPTTSSVTDPQEIPACIIGGLPTAQEVIAALEWAGFIRPDAWLIVAKPQSALYKVILPGYGDVPSHIFRGRILGAFCEEATIPALRTKGADVHLLLKLNGFDSLGDLPI